MIVRGDQQTIGSSVELDFSDVQMLCSFEEVDRVDEQNIGRSLAIRRGSMPMIGATARSIPDSVRKGRLSVQTIGASIQALQGFERVDHVPERLEPASVKTFPCTARSVGHTEPVARGSLGHLSRSIEDGESADRVDHTVERLGRPSLSNIRGEQQALSIDLHAI